MEYYDEMIEEFEEEQYTTMPICVGAVLISVLILFSLFDFLSKYRF